MVSLSSFDTQQLSWHDQSKSKSRLGLVPIYLFAFTDCFRFNVWNLAILSQVANLLFWKLMKQRWSLVNGQCSLDMMNQQYYIIHQIEMLELQPSSIGQLRHPAVGAIDSLASDLTFPHNDPGDQAQCWHSRAVQTKIRKLSQKKILLYWLGWEENNKNNYHSTNLVQNSQTDLINRIPKHKPYSENQS